MYFSQSSPSVPITWKETDESRAALYVKIEGTWLRYFVKCGAFRLGEEGLSGWGKRSFHAKVTLWYSALWQCDESLFWNNAGFGTYDANMNEGLWSVQYVGACKKKGAQGT